MTEASTLLAEASLLLLLSPLQSATLPLIWISSEKSVGSCSTCLVLAYTRHWLGERSPLAQRQDLDKRPKITSMVFYGGNRFLGIFFHRQDGKARDVFLPKTG
jgi:hypothetical protein